MLCRRKVHSSRAHFAFYLVFEDVFVESSGPGQARLGPQVADVVCAAVFQRNQVVDFYVGLVAFLAGDAVFVTYLPLGGLSYVTDRAGAKSGRAKERAIVGRVDLAEALLQRNERNDR